VHLVERIDSAHVHGRWRGASLGEPPFQRLPATGAGRSFGYVGVDARELRADLVDGGDVVPIDDEDGWLRVGQIATHSRGASRQFDQQQREACLRRREIEQQVPVRVLARTATRLPLPQPAARSRLANLFGEPGGVGVAQRTPAGDHEGLGCSRTQ
jgi:hypothetical protein